MNMSSDNEVSVHYTHAGLLTAIKAMSKTIDNIKAELISPVEIIARKSANK